MRRANTCIWLVSNIHFPHKTRRYFGTLFFFHSRQTCPIKEPIKESESSHPVTGPPNSCPAKKFYSISEGNNCNHPEGVWAGWGFEKLSSGGWIPPATIDAVCLL